MADIPGPFERPVGLFLLIYFKRFSEGHNYQSKENMEQKRHRGGSRVEATGVCKLKKIYIPVLN